MTALWDAILREDSLQLLIAQAREMLPSEPASRALELLERQTRRTRAVPTEIAERFNHLRLRTFGTWLRARENGDYSAYKGLFADLIAARTAIANYEGFVDEPYDSCVSDLEPSLTAGSLVHLVEIVLNELQPLITEVNARDQVAWTAPQDLAVTDRNFLQYVGDLLDRVGYDKTRGAVAWGPSISVTDVGPSDIRISLSNRVAGDPIRYVREAMHEGGHALYAQGMPADWAETPLGDAPSVGLHESQALLWELHVCRSYQFWEEERDRFTALFRRLANRDAGWLFRACNRDVITLDAAEAGELSFVRHVWLRLQLERMLINGELLVKDLPEATDSLYRGLFGQPGSSDHIVHQEISWAFGYFGYIPIYLIGRIYAAQIAERMRVELGPGAFDEGLRGDFQILRGWLQDKVYSLGGLLPSREMILGMSGVNPLENPAAYIAHLRQRYSDFP